MFESVSSESTMHHFFKGLRCSLIDHDERWHINFIDVKPYNQYSNWNKCAQDKEMLSGIFYKYMVQLKMYDEL